MTNLYSFYKILENGGLMLDFKSLEGLVESGDNIFWDGQNFVNEHRIPVKINDGQELERLTTHKIYKFRQDDKLAEGLNEISIELMRKASPSSRNKKGLIFKVC